MLKESNWIRYQAGPHPELVGTAGIEPATPCVSSKCSTNELGAHLGAVRETRTLTDCSTRPSSVPVYQFQHDRVLVNPPRIELGSRV